MVRRFIQFQESGNREAARELMRRVTDEDVANALETLKLDSFRRYDWLNTIIIFDDVGNCGLFKKPESYFNTRLKLCRDDNAIYYMAIHGITQLNPSIKENTLVTYVFKGLNPSRLDVVFRQMNLAIDLRDFRNIYNSISEEGKRFFWCDNYTGEWGTE
jgi:hypothetical protein